MRIERIGAPVGRASAEGHGGVAMAMAARMYVEHVRSLRLREAAVAMELEAARSGAVRARSLSQSSGGGPERGDDAVFALVARTADLQAEWEADAAELAAESEEFRRCLSEVPDPAYRLALAMRANGCTWAEVAAELHMSERSAYRVGEFAYTALWSVMPEPWRRLAFPDCRPAGVDWA